MLCEPSKEPRNRFPPLSGRYDNPIWRTCPTGYIGWRNWFLWIDSWTSWTFTNSGSSSFLHLAHRLMTTSTLRSCSNISFNGAHTRCIYNAMVTGLKAVSTETIWPRINCLFLHISPIPFPHPPSSSPSPILPPPPLSPSPSPPPSPILPPSILPFTSPLYLAVSLSPHPCTVKRLAVSRLGTGKPQIFLYSVLPSHRLFLTSFPPPFPFPFPCPDSSPLSPSTFSITLPPSFQQFICEICVSTFLAEVHLWYLYEYLPCRSSSVISVWVPSFQHFICELCMSIIFPAVYLWTVYEYHLSSSSSVNFVCVPSC